MVDLYELTCAKDFKSPSFFLFSAKWPISMEDLGCKNVGKFMKKYCFANFDTSFLISKKNFSVWMSFAW